MDQTCIICYTPFVRDGQVIKLPCNEGHLFHVVCLKTWFENEKSTCPTCRTSITLEMAHEMAQRASHQTAPPTNAN